MFTEEQRLNCVVGNAIRFEMLVLGAAIRPTQFNTTIYALGNTNRYAQLEYFRDSGYKLRLKWYKTRQFRTANHALMSAFWRRWLADQRETGGR